MTPSKKEQIFARIEQRIRGIDNEKIAYDEVKYNNTVGYVDRQFVNIQDSDIKKHGTTWVIINEMKEDFKPLIGGSYEVTVRVQIIGFVQALPTTPDLATLINSLQKDVMIAMIKDVELDRLCSYLVPVSTRLVDNMKFPYGGFVSYFDITYVTQGFEI